MNKVLIWTRSIDSWTEDQELLAGKLPPGTNVLHLPCLTTLPVAPLLAITHDLFDTVVLTSSQAFLQMHQQPSLRKILDSSLLKITHGQATAQLARQNGYQVTCPEHIRSAAALSHWIVDHVPPENRIIVPSPKEPAFDIASDLTLRGRHAMRVVVYETRSILTNAQGQKLSPSEEQNLKSTMGGVVCFASPSAVKGFIATFPVINTELNHRLIAAVIGPTTEKEAVSHFARVVVAPANSLTALLDTALNQTSHS